LNLNTARFKTAHHVVNDAGARVLAWIDCVKSGDRSFDVLKIDGCSLKEEGGVLQLVSLS